MSSYFIKEVTKIGTGLQNFTNTVYKNFIHLAKYPRLNHNKKEIKKLLTTDDGIYYFIYDKKGMILGYLLGEFKNVYGRYMYYITYLYTAQNYRNRKIASQLLNRVIKKCHHKGVNFVTLTCDTKDDKVLNFYKRRGFMFDPTVRTFEKYDVLTLFL